ncbi:hypothetical protein D1007_60992 [Hordeum vulgare]|nr:hypothetical protein D1007_60992 [Hordeum vulgare]
MPPRPARSGAGRGGGVVKRGRSLTNAASAQTGGHIDLDDDEEGFYCTNFNMLQNSDEEEDDSDERGFDNAKWNEPRLELFLKLVIREISDGNRPNNQMAPVGWKNICRDFRRSCGQKYNVKAMKNRGLVNEIKIDREEGKKKEDNYAKREEARSRAMQWMAATMDQWAEEDEEEKEQEAAATERRKNIIFSAAQIIGTRRSRLRFECVRVKLMGWLVIVGPHEPRAVA